MACALSFSTTTRAGLFLFFTVKRRERLGGMLSDYHHEAA
jgi:hypothetical protein